MKTRKEAEARAMELFPDNSIPNSTTVYQSDLENEQRRQAFLQCWEEMQANKQTCGFCVEPISLDHNNIPESVYSGNIKESDAKQSNQDEFPCVDCLTPAECGDCEQCLNELFKKPTIHNIFEQQQVKEQTKDNRLREAAEKVVKFRKERLDGSMYQAIKELEKALK